MGTSARADYDGCLVFGDNSTPNAVKCNAVNRVVFRALGGIFFLTSGTAEGNYAGAYLAPGAQAWNVPSDRGGKENFAPVEAREVLAKVVALPISTWNWKSQDAAIRHIGPMAQDLHAAFKLGEDDRHISTVDADGVALAAIQGLHELVQEKDARIAALEVEMAEMRRAVKSLLARSSLDAMIAQRP
jgi:hypothetical protein